jgi:hypothetical protein
MENEEKMQFILCSTPYGPVMSWLIDVREAARKETMEGAVHGGCYILSHRDGGLRHFFGRSSAAKVVGLRESKDRINANNESIHHYLAKSVERAQLYERKMAEPTADEGHAAGGRRRDKNNARRAGKQAANTAISQGGDTNGRFMGACAEGHIMGELSKKFDIVPKATLFVAIRMEKGRTFIIPPCIRCAPVIQSVGGAYVVDVQQVLDEQYSMRIIIEGDPHAFVPFCGPTRGMVIDTDTDYDFM